MVISVLSLLGSKTKFFIFKRIQKNFEKDGKIILDMDVINQNFQKVINGKKCILNKFC